MWTRIPPICVARAANNVRTYVPRGGNVHVARPVKTLEGKVSVQPTKEEKLPKSKQREEFLHSPEYAVDPESFGDFESDFAQVHKSHREYEADADRYKEQVRHWTVKNKYFKPTAQPNFLTYAEKEQIKLLNSQDPDEWTPEKLSESFPADPVTISKVIKAKWSARSEKRIALHDQSAMSNWDSLKRGKITNLSKELAEHLEKFANRSAEDLKGTETGTRQFPQLPRPKSSEFSSIITSCKKYKESVGHLEPETASDLRIHSGTDESVGGGQQESYLLGKVLNKRSMRLQDLREKRMIPDERVPLHPVSENPEGTGILQPFKSTATTEIVVSKDDMKTYEMNAVKEKIHIPRKLWRRGATYKVQDCYYDDDGEFLYRVPGMTGR